MNFVVVVVRWTVRPLRDLRAERRELRGRVEDAWYRYQVLR